MLTDSAHIFSRYERIFVTCYQPELLFLRNKLQQSGMRDLRKIASPSSSRLRQLVLLSPEMARLQYLQVQRKVSVLAFYL